MTVTLPSEDIDAAVRHEAALHWGWALLGSAGVFCAFTSGLLYYWLANADVGDFRFWVAGLFCAPSYLLGSIGFIQVTSGTTFIRLHRAWPTLSLLRRFVISLFVFVATYALIVYSYFLVSLTTTPHINGEI